MDAELKERFDRLEENSINIKKLLLGNGKMGVAEMARRAFEYVQYQNKTKNGRLDWTFRAIIVVLIGYISVKVGLK